MTQNRRNSNLLFYVDPQTGQLAIRGMEMDQEAYTDLRRRFLYSIGGEERLAKIEEEYSTNLRVLLEIAESERGESE